jgi:hypothetical protein
MATINLGAIKFNWQGAYAGGTAYAVDDVVSYNGSSYICKLASTGNLPTDTTYWDQMSQKGTDADLLSIASTAQGDIYYNNGGAIARLGAGTSGQALLTGGSGANPSWGTISTAKSIEQVVFSQTSTRFSSSSDSYVATPITVTITPSSASNKIMIWCRATHATYQDNYPRYAWFRSIGGGAFTKITTEPSNSNGGSSLGAYIGVRHSSNAANIYELQQFTDFFQDTTHSTTSAITYTLYGVRENGGTFYVNTTQHNESGATNDYNQVGTSNMMAWEMTV